MDTSFIIFQSMLRLSKEYNPQDLNAWQEAHTLGQQSDLIAENLKQRGFELVLSDGLKSFLKDIEDDLNDNTNLTGE
jgi:phage tail tape-measure protein